MKLNKRKGFTVVELVIVIAIIAVLAAVLIPTFAGLVRKANISKDTQLVRNLNTALATATEKPKTMHEALQIAADAGYLVDKINASATSNEILYDSKNNVFCYYNATNPSEGSVEYIPESAQGSQINDSAEYYLLWKIYDKDDDFPDADKQKFSIYLADDAKLPADGKLTVSVGFDAGTNTNVKEVTYNGKKGSVILRTNGGTLTVEDTNDNNQQYFYGSLAEAVVKTGKSCFHAYGTIAKLDLQAGKVVAEAGSIVMVSNAVSGTEVAKSSGSVVMKTSSANIDTNAKVAESSADEKSAYVLEISDAAGLAAFRDSVNSGMTYAGLTVKLTADIDLNGYCNGTRGWTPIGVYKHAAYGMTAVTSFNGVFDGNGKTISNLLIYSEDTTQMYGALFGNVTGATLKNFTVKGLVSGTDVAGVVGALHEGCTVENVTSYVDLTGKQGENDKKEVRGKVAGIVIQPKAAGVVVSNCNNYGNILAFIAEDSNSVGGIVASNGNNIEITNCNNYGNIMVQGIKEVGGIVGSDHSQTMYKNCHNYGNITGNECVGGIVGASNGSFENCSNEGEISGVREVGGIVGKISCIDTNGNTLTDCKNSGKVTATNNSQTNCIAGGLVGFASKEASVTVTFTNCENTSTEITGREGYVGQIIGYVWSNESSGYKVKFDKCKGIDSKDWI